MQELYYFDNASTTILDPRVFEIMEPYFKNKYSNPASQYIYGSRIKADIDNARTKVSELIGAGAKDLVFTGSATEGINQALKCVSVNHPTPKRHIITSKVEHKAVVNCCNYLESIGYDISFINVDINGVLDLTELKDKIRHDTLMVSLMYVNNETGVINPIKEISEIVHNADSIFMTDATQAFGKIPIKVEEDGIDILIANGHKIHGPKGIGMLYVNRNVRANMVPLIHGGNQENALRSGTLNVPGIIGLGEAARIASDEMFINNELISEIRTHFEKNILQKKFYVIGVGSSRISGISNICFKNVDASILLTGADGICVSNGSACNAATIEDSHVLTAMGIPSEDIRSAIRFSFSKYNSIEEIDKALSIINSKLNLNIYAN